MKLARIEHAGAISTVAALTDDYLVQTRWLTPDAPADDVVALVTQPDLLARLAQRCAGLRADLEAGRVSATWLEQEGVLVRVSAATFAPPVSRCSKCVCVALNYSAHAAEGAQAAPSAPLFFLKSAASLIGHGQPVIAPRLTQRVDYETELAVIIGQRCRDLTLENWQQAVAGYSIINDVTARDMQIAAIEANQPWDRTKSFDTFGPIGPWLVTPDEVPDPQDLEVELKIGEAVRQFSNTRHMLFSVAQLLVTITENLTLEPGDILATGTPQGIGPVAHAEVMYARIGHLGTLVNPVHYPADLHGAAH